jgi:uncharacterized protein (TIGR02444 family)
MNRSLRLDNPFWQFSLQLYAASGVAQECLTLHDESGVNVNMLLYCAWRGAEADALSASRIEHLDKVVEAWRADVVAPLRAARRSLQGMALIDAAALEELKPKILDAEIRAEQIEQALLFEQTDSNVQRTGLDSAIDVNLGLYLNRYGQTIDAVPAFRSAVFAMKANSRR